MKNIIELIGDTPLLECVNISKELVNVVKNNRIFGKLECFNPSGSIKDRTALNIIKEGFNAGMINQNTTILEASSGNMGISLAMIANFYNLKCCIFMPENVSLERVKMLEFYNSKVFLSDGTKGMIGAIQKLEEFRKQSEDYFYCDQFNNINNYLAHFQLAEELLHNLDKIDIVVSCIGSGGTITGLSKYLKCKRPDIKIYGIEPNKSPVITKGTSGSHGIQGIGAGFVPSILDLNNIDEVITVDDEEAFQYQKMICKLEGVFVGISSGACLAGTIKIIKKYNYVNKNVVLIFPDSGYKYLSLI